MPESLSDPVGNIEFMTKKMRGAQVPKATCSKAMTTALNKLMNDTTGKLSDYFKDLMD